MGIENAGFTDPNGLDQKRGQCRLEYLETSHRTFCKTHQRDEIACVKEKLGEAVDALNKIHDLAGQMSGPNPHPHLGAIQDWCHRVTGYCCDLSGLDKLMAYEKSRPSDPTHTDHKPTEWGPHVDNPNLEVRFCRIPACACMGSCCSEVRKKPMKREDLLDGTLNQAMEILMKVVDSDDCRASIRYDAQQLVLRWQRGDFLK